MSIVASLLELSTGSKIPGAQKFMSIGSGTCCTKYLSITIWIMWRRTGICSFDAFWDGGEYILEGEGRNVLLVVPLAASCHSLCGEMDQFVAVGVDMNGCDHVAVVQPCLVARPPNRHYDTVVVEVNFIAPHSLNELERYGIMSLRGCQSWSNTRQVTTNNTQRQHQRWCGKEQERWGTEL